MIRSVLGLASLLFTASALGHGAASTSTPDQGREIQFPDTAEYKTLTVDLHTHSVFSDGHVWPSIRVSEALRDGLDAVAITEHLEWQPHIADIPHPDRNRAYDDALASAKDQDILVIPGTEITREAPAGHINAVFVTDANLMLNADPAITGVREFYVEANQWPAQEAVQAANEQGAFVFWNHPYWVSQNPTGLAVIPKFHRDNAKNNLLHGIEIANGDTYSEEAFAIALKHDLTLIGVSDVHNLIDWDYKPHEGGHRPVTLVLAKERSADGIKEALFAKRTVVWFKNELYGRKPELAMLLDASIQVVDASWRDDSSVLRVSIENRSDARFVLHNRSRHTFMETSDLITLPPHQVTTLQVKPGKRVEALELTFKVMNALTAPGKPADLKLDVVL